jgi:hypothetical protein
MNTEAKKVAAMLAAVHQFIEEEQATAAMTPSPPAAVSLWALAGRQQIMNTRALLVGRLWK